MKICNYCLYPQPHPLGIDLDEKGICSGCRVHQEKATLNWEERFNKLVQFVAPYRSKTKTRHDCIVPVSGAGDSYFIVDIVKNKLGLNPLLVAYNNHYNTNVGTHNLEYLKALFDCDCLLQTVSPTTVKAITKATLRELGSIYWHCVAGATAFPAQIAVRFNIPLIIWGEHLGVEQVGMYSHLDEATMSREYRKNNELMNIEMEDLLSLAPELNERDMLPYDYPCTQELTSLGVCGIYLSNYINWDTKTQHEDMIKRFGYETMPQPRTFDAYNYADSWHYAGLHDLLKQQKTGLCIVVDNACREIRHGRITREQAFKIVLAYQQRSAPDLQVFLDWLGMSSDEFDILFESHASGLKEQYLETLAHSIIPKSDDIPEDCGYIQNSSRVVPHKEDKYILVGRGWIDGWNKNP